MKLPQLKILERYILGYVLRSVLLALGVFTALFLVIEFLDRVDNLMQSDASFWTMLQYFLFKIPQIVSLMLPVAVLVATIMTFGVLSKNSEITAMRSAGLQILWIARPLFCLAFGLSLFALILDESVVPYCTRRVKEIYNIDIRQKDKTGTYSQEDFWWRAGSDFYSVDIFDSRTDSFHRFSKFELDPEFKIAQRTDAGSVQWIDELLGWNMKDVLESKIDYDTPSGKALVQQNKLVSLPLPIGDKPEEFYEAKTDPQTMSYRELSRFIKQQKRNGIKVSGYAADLYAKLAFPFSILVVAFAALPFALRPARSGSMAVAIISSFVLGFAYYTVHSMSISLGRAEIWPPFFAAWMANFVLGFVGVVLNLGAEAP